MSGWTDEILPRLSAMGIDKRLPVLATVLLTLLLAQSLALLTWDMLPKQGPGRADLPESALKNSAQIAPGRQIQVDQISQWHLFGEVQKVNTKMVARVTEAPDTRLNLKLLGVLSSSEPLTARAIISDGKGDEDAYAVGGQLPGNAVLKEIYADRVILEYRGRLEALRLPTEAGVAGGLSTVSSRFASGEGQSSADTSVHTVSDTKTSGLLRQYREAMINDPQSLMNLVSAAPVTDKLTGKLKGYRVQPGKDRKLLGQFGLKSGDVVTAVNGVSLDNPVKALEIMRDLSTASSVSLDVERGGQMQSFSFQID